MSERKLASIQMINDISPIEYAPGVFADAIERAKVLNWNVVVKKGEFKIGDLCIYFEIDSLLPVIPAFAFLSKKKPKKCIVEGIGEVEGYVLKSIRLKGVVSQGLALPLSLFPVIGALPPGEGADVSNLIGVHKYEEPIAVEMQGMVKGNFPDFLAKSDENRIQGFTSEEFNTYHRNNTYTISCKIDGSSFTCYKNNSNEFGVCSRNLELKESETNIYWRMAKRYSLAEKMPIGYAIQAEVAGESISSNRLKLKGQDLYVFAVIQLGENINENKYLSTIEMINFCNTLGLKTVPILDDNFKMENQLIEDLIKMADGKSVLNPNELREGIVFRKNGKDKKDSFKCISNDYLLKHGI